MCARGAGFSKAEPWLPIPAIHQGLSVADQEQDPNSVLTFTWQLLHWRKSRPAVVAGALRLLHVDEGLLVIECEIAEDIVLAVFNLSDKPREYPLPDRAAALSRVHTDGRIERGVLRLPLWSGAFVELTR